MGRREKKLKSVKLEETSASEEESRKTQNPAQTIASDDDEANEDLSLKIVQKAAMLQECNGNRGSDGGLSMVTDLGNGEKEKKRRRKKKKSTEIESPDEDVSGEIDNGFKDFCGDLIMVDNVIGGKRERVETDESAKIFENTVDANPDEVPDNAVVVTDEAVKISENAVDANPDEVPDNAVLRKLLRGPRYFDPPDSSWGACYNCGEQGHVTANCTSARRKKPCFVCGSFEHNARQCSKGRDCFICKQQGHRAKDCPEKNSLKICLKCGDIGHEMFTCRNEYCTEDLKIIQCYICHNFGHLCCVEYGSPSKKVVSCYRCGGSGHTGLSCKASYGDTSGTGTSNSCYRCGEGGHFARECTNAAKGGDMDSSCYLCGGAHYARECTSAAKGGDTDGSCYKCGGEGHFARECTFSKKASKRNREPSTPKLKSSKKSRDHKDAKSAPPDLGKTHKKKNSHIVDFSSPRKTKHRGGWIAEDPRHSYSNMPRANNNWRSPVTPTDRRFRIPVYNDPIYNGNYASSSHSYRNPHIHEYSNSPANGPPGYYQQRFSASRFGNSSNGGTGRNNGWW